MLIRLRLIFVCLLLVLSYGLMAQQGFTDDFTDGDFTNNPNWFGQATLFEVNAMSQLQLNNPAAASNNISYLSTNSLVINSASWEFYIKLGFDPSSSNLAKVFLVSDNQDLSQNLNGYYVQIGGQSGTVDDIRLYRKDGSIDNLLIDGVDGVAGTSPELKIKVVKDSTNKWELFVDQSATGTNYVSQGIATDNTYGNSSFFGVYCKYTKTRADKFTFDDFIINGVAFQDTIKPSLNSVTVVDSTHLLLAFSELLDASSAENNNNYSVNKGIRNPSQAQFENNDSSLVKLTFASEFINGEEYNLITQNVTDRSSNNMLNDTSSYVYFVPVPAVKRDIVINEIYADFTPSNGLPEVEFIELYNASNKVFDLSNWTVSDGTTNTLLGNYIIKPNQFVIICIETAVSAFQTYGETLGTSSFPSLNNSGDAITLRDGVNNLIDNVEYDLDWYNDPLKSAGGYTLEQINPFSVCTGQHNFAASNNLIGGTPGTQNSVYSTLPDTIAPILNNAFILSADSILLEFSELLDSSSALSASYNFSPTLNIATISNQPPSYNSVILELGNPLDSGIIYSLNIENIKDCSGNTIDVSNTINLALPSDALSNDVIINEILFNPRTGGVEFVEIYNRSSKVITLKNWAISNVIEDPIANKKTISDQAFLLFAGEYLALSENSNTLVSHYPSSKEERLFEINDLPSLNNTEGIVYLINSKDRIIDEVNYSDDQHFALLSDDKGVSLERISTERPSNEIDNFHSAAENVGFATPGYENSQEFATTRFNGKITVDPETFSPDNDGFNDVVNINYEFTAPGFVVSVEIYDKAGRKVKSLVQNELVGSKGTFSWDGITDDNDKARVGIYIALIKAFNTNGDEEVFKEVIVVASFLD